MKKSRRVRDGSIVQWHGTKLVCVGRRTKTILGVYQSAYALTMLTDAGRRRFELPDGVVLSGRTTALVDTE